MVWLNSFCEKLRLRQLLCAARNLATDGIRCYTFFVRGRNSQGEENLIVSWSNYLQPSSMQFSICPLPRWPSDQVAI